MTRNEEAEPQAGAPVGPPVQIVGIGADGWSGLGAAAREALEAARVVLGSPRQLDLLPAHVTAERVAWPSPLRPAVAPLLVQHASCGLAVLASGDPMHFGIGRLLTDTLRATADDAQWIVHPSPSSMSLACARLGWPVEDVEVVSAVGRDVRTLNARLAPGRRILVLSADGDTPGEVAALLRDGGYGPTRMRVLGDLGSPQESLVEARAAHWPATPAPRLNIVALECVPDDSDDLNDPDDSVDDRHGRSLDSRDGDAFDPRAWPGLVPGLPDTRYETDGQLTKWEVRAVTLAALAQPPGSCCGTSAAAAGASASNGCAPTPRVGPSPSRRAPTGPPSSRPMPAVSACRVCASSSAPRPTRWPIWRPTGSGLMRSSSEAASRPRVSCRRAGTRCDPADASSPTR